MKTEGHLGRCDLKGREARQRRPERCRLQSPPGPRVAEDFFAPHPARVFAAVDTPTMPQFGLLTAD
jgi:hypothetical protein